MVIWHGSAGQQEEGLHLSFTQENSHQHQQKHGPARIYLMEALLSNPTVFNVKNAVESLHVRADPPLPGLPGWWDTAGCFHTRGAKWRSRGFFVRMATPIKIPKNLNCIKCSSRQAEGLKGTCRIRGNTSNKVVLISIRNKLLNS